MKTRLKEDKANNVYGFGLSRTLYDALCKSYISSTRKTKLAGFERASENARLLAEEDFRLFGRGRSRLDSKAWDRIKELGL